MTATLRSKTFVGLTIILLVKYVSSQGLKASEAEVLADINAVVADHENELPPEIQAKLPEIRREASFRKYSISL